MTNKELNCVKKITMYNLEGKLVEYNEKELKERISELLKCVGFNLKYCFYLYEECYGKKILQKDYLPLLGYTSKKTFNEHCEKGNFPIETIIRACLVFGLTPKYLLFGESIANNYRPFMSLDDYQYLTFKSRKERILDELKRLYDLQESEKSFIKDCIIKIKNHEERSVLGTNFSDFCKNYSIKKNKLFVEDKSNKLNIKENLIKKFRKRIKMKLLEKIDDITQEANKRAKANCYIDKDGAIHKARTHEVLGYLSLCSYEDDYCYDFSDESRQKT